MDDAVAVPLERGPDRILGFGPEPAARLGAPGGLRRQHLPLSLLELFTNDGRHRSHVDGGRCRDTARLSFSQDLAEKAGAVPDRADAKQLAQGLCEIREGRPRTEVDAGP